MSYHKGGHVLQHKQAVRECSYQPATTTKTTTSSKSETMSYHEGVDVLQHKQAVREAVDGLGPPRRQPLLRALLGLLEVELLQEGRRKGNNVVEK